MTGFVAFCVGTVLAIGGIAVAAWSLDRARHWRTKARTNHEAADGWRRSYARERAARFDAERTLEAKTRLLGEAIEQVGKLEARAVELQAIAGVVQRARNAELN